MVPDTTQASGLVNALMAGDMKTVIALAFMFALAHYGTFVLSYAASKVKLFIDYCKGRINEIPAFQTTTIDDKFFDLLAQAVSNQAHLNVALAEAIADGSISQEDLKKMVAAVYEDFKANLGLSNIWDIIKQLFGGDTAQAEKAIEAKFNANVYAVLGNLTKGIASAKADYRRFRVSYMTPAEKICCDPAKKSPTSKK